MATDATAGASIELPAEVVAAMTAELAAGASSSPLEPLRALTTDADVDWQRELADRGLIEDGELVPWLARALSVLMWPEALVRTRDTAGADAATRFIAADTLVQYGQADGVCVIGRPAERDAFVDELVALSTAVTDRIGEPPVLELTRWTLEAVDTVLAGDRALSAALAALAALMADPHAPAAIVEAMIADELLVGGDVLSPGPALTGWDDALDTGSRLEIQRMDLAEGPEAAEVRTMVFIGQPGKRCLIVPRGGDDLLLVRPTTEEASTLIDAFLTPGVPDVEDEAFVAVLEAWRAGADTLIAEAPR